LDNLTDFLENGVYDPAFVRFDPASPTRMFELSPPDFLYSVYRPDLAALGAVDGRPEALRSSELDPRARWLWLCRPVQGRLGKIPWSAIMHVTPRNGCMFSCGPPPPVAVVEPDPPPVTPGAVVALPGASETLAAPAL
jgi:hypothetical protein